MSYILDALKKAAEQRDVHAPAMRRLFAPSPELVDSPRWRIALVGGGAAFAGAAVVAVVWMLWSTVPLVPVTERLDLPPATARVEPQPPAVVEPPPPPAPPIVRTAPTTAAPEKSSPPKRPGQAAPRIVETRRPPSDAAPERSRRPASEESLEGPEPDPGSPPVIAAVRPVPPPVATRPPAARPSAPAAGRPAETGSPMKLEVIVYSDERARRLAFINGRKYVEGDTLLDGAKIQEIQPNAVVIVEDGRRLLLRP